MGRTSGPFPLGTLNTWAQQQTFSGAIVANATLLVNSTFRIAATIHVGAATIGSGEAVSLCDTTGGAFTLTLPAAPAANEVHYVKNFTAGANALTLAGNGHHIDAAATQTLGAQAHMMVLYDATNTVWRIIA